MTSTPTCVWQLVARPFAATRLTRILHVTDGPARLQACEQLLNAWCEANCPHAPQHSPLYARIDTNMQQGIPQWRCYAKSTLTSDLMRYKNGDTYCTRPYQLGQLLQTCIHDKKPISPTASRNTETASTQNRRPQFPAVSPRGPSPTGMEVTDASCEDAVSECAVWAAYDECLQSREFMVDACPAACRTCHKRDIPTTSANPSLPPKLQPSPPTPEPPGKKELPRPATFCASPCDSAKGPAACSGRGKCNSSCGNGHWPRR